MAEPRYTDVDQSLEAIREIQIENVLNDLSRRIQREVTNGSTRFAAFQAGFDNEFGVGTQERGAAEALTWAVFEAPLALLYVGQVAAVFVELHGLLERFALRDLCGMLAKDARTATIIESLTERKTLKDVAKFLRDFGVWDNKDAQFVGRLSNIRNGIAHKNPVLLSKCLGNGQQMELAEAEQLVRETDCVPDFLETIRLMVKLSLAWRAGRKE